VFYSDKPIRDDPGDPSYDKVYEKIWKKRRHSRSQVSQIYYKVNIPTAIGKDVQPLDCDTG